MRLWTWHKPDFSLTSGRVDNTLSSYFKSMPKIPAAYAELAKRLETDQIIWCYVRPDEYRKHPGDPCVEWILDVPDDKLLGIIDSWVWERIIGSGAYPPELREKWAYEAIERDLDYEAHIEAREQEYLNQPPPNVDWWESLFIESINHDNSTVLVQHPVPELWVVRDGSKAG